MEYREIVAVTGLGGLFQLLTTKSDGAIVRNVADKTTRFISARQHNVTPLESIEVYTTGENVRLQHVFRMMQEHEATIPIADVKIADNNAIKAYFKSIFPEFDEERVYVSDMKKMLKWYDILKLNDLLRFEEEVEEAPETEATETVAAAEEVKEETAEPDATEKTEATETPAEEKEETGEKPKKAAKKKKAETEAGDVVEGEEKPAKKTAKKKKTEE
jgi:uncharacterized protein DUF6852/uncharacterized protein DUF5606